MRKQAGFTMIELVVVIMILGILSATALPKFLDMSTNAHRAAVDGTGGALRISVALVHTGWLANGLTGAQDNIQGFGDDDVDVNADGWPVSTNGNNGNPNNNRCMQVWNGVMEGPPTVATNASEDYRVTSAAGVCTFTYQDDTTRIIAYDSTGGTVTITNP